MDRQIAEHELLERGQARLRSGEIFVGKALARPAGKAVAKILIVEPLANHRRGDRYCREKSLETVFQQRACAEPFAMFLEVIEPARRQVRDSPDEIQPA